MLISCLKFAPLQRFYDLQRRHRHRLRTRDTSRSPVRRSSLLVAGTVLLAGAMLLAAGAFRSTAHSPSLERDVTRHDAAAVDGRATSDRDEARSTGQTRDPIVTRLNRDCAAHARERLITGLTHYYLQRRLRPGASSEDAADISSQTEVLAGPGDPAATTVTEASCAV